MTEETGGVRDHLANERTQLAWLRTGANVMVVGLAVARFADHGGITAASLVAGAVLVLTGAGAIGFGTLRYRRVAEELRRGTAATASSTAGPTVAALLLLVAVLAAAAVLMAWG